MDRARTHGVAFSLWLAGVALSLAGLVLQILTRDVPVDYYGVRGFQGPLGVLLGGVGVLIIRSRRRNPIGWIFTVAGFLSTLQGFDSGYVTYSISSYGGSLPGTTVLTWLSVWIWAPFVGAMATWVLLLFPEERLDGRGIRWIAGYSTVALAIFSAVISVLPGQSGETPVGVTNPLGIDPDLHARLMSLAGPSVIIAFAASVAVLVRRFHRARGVRRQQLKWLTFSGAIAGGMLAFNLAVQGGGVSSGVVDRVSAIGVMVSFGAMPVAAGVAILRYGLYEIDVVIKKTIVYAVVAAFITAVYVGVVIGIGALVGSGSNTALTVAATAIVALAIQPVRSRGHRLANRLVFGERASPYEALSAFAASLSDDVASEDALPRLARLMTEATAATSASVWFVAGDTLRPAGVWPPRDVRPQPVTQPVGDRTFEVRHDDELLGLLAVEVGAGDPLSPAEERVLEDLASQAGLLLRNARLIQELRASRQRLVTAQDAERRRIERDLHDGAQQQLVALAVNLKLARTVLEADPGQVGPMLEQLRDEATSALENLRDLARGIYPPMLAERGLVAALGAQAAKAPIPVQVEGEGVGRYPMEAESAIYFCVLEAMQNIAKYAEASSARVEITDADGRLRFLVADDGRGFDPATVARGAGLTNMADRLDALGGTLQVRSAPGEGSAIEGWIDTVLVLGENGVRPQAADAGA